MNTFTALMQRATCVIAPYHKAVQETTRVLYKGIPTWKKQSTGKCKAAGSVSSKNWAATACMLLFWHLGWAHKLLFMASIIFLGAVQQGWHSNHL